MRVYKNRNRRIISFTDLFCVWRWWVRLFGWGERNQPEANGWKAKAKGELILLFGLLAEHHSVVGPFAEWVEDQRAEDGHGEALRRETGVDEEEAQLLTATIAGGLVDAVSADAQKAQRGCKQNDS